MENLIIKDEEFINYADSLININNAVENELASLVNILSDVCTKVVTEGDFHKNLEAFVSKLSEMEGELSFLLEIEKTIATDFISEIDEIDNTVYK